MQTLTEGQAQVAIINYLVSNLPSSISASNCLYPNSTGDREDNKPFFDITLEWGQSVATGAGQNVLYRTPGILVVDINLPKGDGDTLFTSITDHLAGLFRNNRNFRNMGFVLEGIQIDPGDERIRADYYTQIYNVLFYIETF